MKSSKIKENWFDFFLPDFPIAHIFPKSWLMKTNEQSVESAKKNEKNCSLFDLFLIFVCLFVSQTVLRKTGLSHHKSTGSQQTFTCSKSRIGTLWHQGLH